MSNAIGFSSRRRLGLGMVLALIAALVLALLPGVADAAKGKKKGHQITVMTRNLYLGADLTPALQAPGIGEAIAAGGQIVNQVHATKFPSIRAASLAAEIKKRKPDIVGLQEASWWRTGPVNLDPNVVTNPTASTTDPLGGDFITELLNQLNKGKGKKKGKGSTVAAKKGKKKKGGVRYVLAVVKTEFDAELPVDDDPNGGEPLFGADHNERLTMRDAILVRKGVGIKSKNPTSGTFNTLLRVQLAGFLNIDVTRGWTAIDVKARGRSFHFVNTHLEAFDSQGSNQTNQGTTLGRGDVRAAQASQLVGPGGPAHSTRPVILLGDMNSDDDTVQPNGDRNAYAALTAGGFTERSTANPLSCCLNDPFLVGGPNSINDFDHQVDHVLTNTGKIRFVKGFVDGRAPVNGLFPSDHAALTSVLKIK